MSDSSDEAKMTPSQLKAIWAKARERDLTADQVRRLTPRGSVSDLTYQEAHELLNQLGERRPAFGYQKPANHSEPRTSVSGSPRSTRPPRLHAGDVRLLTEAQRARIAELKEQLAGLYGWTSAEMDGWLAARRFKHDHARRMSEPNTSTDGAAVIQLLYHVIPQAKEARAQNAIQSRACEQAVPPVSPPSRASDSLFPDTPQPRRRQRIAASSRP